MNLKKSAKLIFGIKIFIKKIIESNFSDFSFLYSTYKMEQSPPIKAVPMFFYVIA